MLGTMYRLHLAMLRFDIVGTACPRLATRSPPVASQPRHYKFYIHFNSVILCRDYVDPEVWTRALDHGTVPVVFGVSAEDLREKLPPNSYVSADQFASAYELVNYLEYLDTQPEAYRAYFQWRLGAPEAPRSAASGMCELCHVHTAPSEQRRKIKSLHRWWYGVEEARCTEFSDKWSGVRDVSLHRQYFHMWYFMEEPLDREDIFFMLALSLLLAAFATALLLVNNFQAIRRLWLVAFVSRQVCTLAEALLDVWRDYRFRRSGCGHEVA